MIELSNKGLVPIQQGALAGLGYLFWAVADAYIYPVMPFDQTITHFDAAFRALLIGVPTGLAFFRHGLYSAIFLAVLALLNTTGHVIGMAEGKFDSNLNTIVLHGAFAFVLSRSAWAAWKIRKS